MSDAFWQAMGPVLVALVGGPLVLLVSRSDKKPADPPPSGERQAIEVGLGVSTAGVPDESIAVFARLYGDISALRTELGLERTYADDLDDHIEDMIAGHSSGRYPPWPEKPTRSGSTRA